MRSDQALLLDMLIAARKIQEFTMALTVNKVPGKLLLM